MNGYGHLIPIILSNMTSYCVLFMYVCIHAGTNSLIEVQRKAQNEKNVVLDLDAFDVAHFESNVVDNYKRRKESKIQGGQVMDGSTKNAQKKDEERLIDGGLERTKPSAVAVHRSNATSKVAPSHHHDSSPHEDHDLQGGSEVDDDSSYDGGQQQQHQHHHPSKKQNKKKSKKEKKVLPPIKVVGSPKVAKYQFEDEDYVYPDPTISSSSGADKRPRGNQLMTMDSFSQGIGGLVD